ncbi:MAG: CehA/McbA family metallohydrolase [Chloroflexi bacterium]|nr:CehA/McbA family metallohydrolase [Chloroflexota bacterium]MCL5075990.1 CehA/McbA family metallohydrolase [Chloroflexota bacterium]
MRWYKGNLHTHTTNSNDGKSTPQELCNWYRDHGYDFLAFTDHDHITDETDYQSPDGLLTIRGEEVSSNHLLALNVWDLINKQLPMQEKVEHVCQQGGCCIVAHPNWQHDHWPLALLESTVGYIGIEIFNANITTLEGSAFALDKWDQLLTKGRQVWGMASDDVHDLARGLAGRGWVVVRAPELSQAAILGALVRGDFYASTGVELETLSMDKGTLYIAACQAQEIIFIGEGGQILERVGGSVARYISRGDEKYVRAECRGPQGAAYTQPLFVSPSSFGR